MYVYVCVCIHVYVCMHNILGELSGGNVLPKTGGGIVRGNCPTPHKITSGGRAKRLSVSAGRSQDKELLCLYTCMSVLLIVYISICAFVFVSVCVLLVVCVCVTVYVHLIVCVCVSVYMSTLVSACVPSPTCAIAFRGLSNQSAFDSLHC